MRLGEALTLEGDVEAITMGEVISVYVCGKFAECCGGWEGCSVAAEGNIGQMGGMNGNEKGKPVISVGKEVWEVKERHCQD